MAAAVERPGHLGVLHDNTAFVPRGPLGDIGLDDWRKAFTGTPSLQAIGHTEFVRFPDPQETS